MRQAIKIREEVIPSTVAPSRDVAFINAVVNHPEVRPFIGSPDLGELDLSPAVSRSENLFMIGIHGGFALGWSAPGVREVHTFILPSGRGAWARRARAEMVSYCRKAGDTMLWTKIPPGQPHVVQFAREAGMRPTGQEVETFGVMHEVYKMELQRCQ